MCCVFAQCRTKMNVKGGVGTEKEGVGRKGVREGGEEVGTHI